MTLSDYLDANKITNAAFAARIGVSRQAVLRYRAGDRTPGHAEMAAIFEATGGAVAPNDFFGITSPQQRETTP